MKNKEENGIPEPNNAEVLTKKFWINPATTLVYQNCYVYNPLLIFKRRNDRRKQYGNV